MNPIYICFLFLTFLCFKGNSAPYADTDSLSVEEMNQIASNILNKLKAAKGILPDEAPTIRVIPFIGNVKIAVMRYDEGLIDLDTRTFKISQTVSKGRDNALSWILGHELGHYIYKHGQINHFDKPSRASVRRNVGSNAPSNQTRHPGFGSATTNVNETIIDAFVKTQNEGEADFEGAFLAFLAGYQPMSAGKELIEKLYSDTLGGLTANTPGYPSLEDRKKIIEETSFELAKLRPKYESAKYLSAIGKYADAATLLEDISRKFQSQEVYNNIGVLHILHSLKNMTDQRVKKYEFPLVYDASFKAPHPQFLGEGITLSETILMEDDRNKLSVYDHCRKTEIQLYMDKAEEFFQKAIALNPNYAEAYLNLSIAQTIKARLFVGNGCTSERELEYKRALGTLMNAKDLAYKLLSATGSYSLEHFDFIPSDTQFPISYPENLSVPHQEIQSKVILDTQNIDGELVINHTLVESIGRPAIYKEVFGRFDLSLDSTLNNRTLFTIWSPEDRVPDQAVFLSKIHVQIDLIRIFQEDFTNDRKLRTLGRGERGVRHVLPFDRALELDRNNRIALRNQKRFLAQPLQLTSSESNLSKVMTFQSQTIDKIANKTRRWQITESQIDKSRLTTFYKRNSDVGFESKEDIYFENVNTLLNFNYLEQPGYKLYFNSSESPIDNRKEHTIFLEPRSFDTLLIDSNIIITPNMHLDTIVHLFEKQPDNSISLVYGQLSSYSTFVNQEVFQLLRTDGSNARGDTIIQNFRQLIKLDTDVIMEFNPLTGEEVSLEIDLSKHEEHGIILKVNSENRVFGYLLYFNGIKTEGGNLHRNATKSFLILSTGGGP